MASSLKVGYLFETAFHKTSKETDKLSEQNYILELEKEIVSEEFDRSTEVWTNREVMLAGKVLNAENPKKHGIKFASDNQMRRVYDIIFEVFRCKIETILYDIFFMIFIRCVIKKCMTAVASITDIRCLTSYLIKYTTSTY